MVSYLVKNYQSTRYHKESIWLWKLTWVGTSAIEDNEVIINFLFGFKLWYQVNWSWPLVTSGSCGHTSEKIRKLYLLLYIGYKPGLKLRASGLSYLKPGPSPCQAQAKGCIRPGLFVPGWVWLRAWGLAQYNTRSLKWSVIPKKPRAPWCVKWSSRLPVTRRGTDGDICT